MYNLNKEQTDLLRQLSLFEIPVPDSLIDYLISEMKCPRETFKKLVSLGIVENYQFYIRLHPLINPFLHPLDTDERYQLISFLLPRLTELWNEESKQKSARAWELTRLAMEVGDVELLPGIAENGVRWLEQQFRYKEGAEAARQIIPMMENSKKPVPTMLYHIGALLCGYVGDMDTQSTWLTTAWQERDRTIPEDTEELVAIGRERALSLNRQGQVQEALRILDNYHEIMEKKDVKSYIYAIIIGDIARILAGKGEVEKALGMHREVLQIYESLGDKDSIAITYFDLGQIYLNQSKYQEAFEAFNLSYRLSSELGRLDSIAFSGMQLGILLFQSEYRKEGLELLEQSRAAFKKLDWSAQYEQVENLIITLTKKE